MAEAVKTTQVINVKAVSTEAQLYSELAKLWAVKTDGKVNNEDYSAKYYALQCKDNADIAQAAADSVTINVDELKQEIIDLADEQEEALIKQAAENYNAVAQAQSEAIAAITDTVNGTEFEDLTTASKTVIGAINELNAQLSGISETLDTINGEEV